MIESRRAGLFAMVLVLALVGTACNGSGGGDAASMKARGGGGDAGSAADQRGRARPALTSGGSDMAFGAAEKALPRPRAATALPQVGPSIIKTAELDLRVGGSDVDQTLQDAVQVAGRYGGFVLSTTSSDDGSGRGTVVLRIPSARFEQALGDIKGLATKVTRASVSGQDVSQEFVDLEARLRNYRAQEVVLLRLMDTAQSVTDTIRVQSELQPVQLEIERITGQLNFLRDQTDFGTITATVAEVGVTPAPDTTIEKSWRQALDTALGFVSAIIVSSGVIVPVGALLLLALLVVRQVGPRFSR